MSPKIWPASRGTPLTIAFLVVILNPSTTAALADENVAFEVASVKLIPRGTPWPGRFLAEPRQAGEQVRWAATADMIIRYAYDMRSFQLRDDHPVSGLYNIEAKTSGIPDNERVRLMFQDLLRERFKFRVHRETRESTIYTITIARGGPKLTLWKERPTPWVVAHLPVSEGVVTNHASREDPHHLVGHKVAVSSLAEFLGEGLKSVVLDKTGLAGYYDFELRWTSLERGLDPPDPATVSAAMQRQLGLRLDKTRGLVDTFVVDQLETPSEN